MDEALKNIKEMGDMVGRSPPTCGVVTNKDNDTCPDDAEHSISVANPDDPTHTQIAAILLICGKHMKLLEEGKTFVFKSGTKFWQINITPDNELSQ